jgi:hypothetical protein
MAVVATKSAVITNADASPAVINSAQIADGQARLKRGQAVVGAADSIASTYRLVRVKSNDLVYMLLLSCSAITSAAADIGLYKTTRDGGAVVDADFFASAQSLATGLTQTNVVRESAVISIPNSEKPIWEQLGLSADPQIEYDVVVTLTAAATAGGSVMLDALITGRN